MGGGKYHHTANKVPAEIVFKNSGLIAHLVY
jgi:hypothetical protein